MLRNALRVVMGTDNIPVTYRNATLDIPASWLQPCMVIAHSKAKLDFRCHTSDGRKEVAASPSAVKPKHKGVVVHVLSTSYGG
jgi:hypothetical protein